MKAVSALATQILKAAALRLDSCEECRKDGPIEVQFCNLQPLGQNHCNTDRASTPKPLEAVAEL